MNYVFHLIIMIEIYLILSYSLNLVMGYAGLMNLAAAAFYGIGAYAFSLLSMKLHFPFLAAFLFAFIFPAVTAYLISKPALKLKGDSFVLLTLGFQMIVFSILYNVISLTRGPYGIPGIPRPEIFYLRISQPWQYLLLISFLFSFIFLFLKKIYDSPYGLALKTIREDDKAAESLGKDSRKYLSQALIISAGISGMAGALFASYITYIDPTSFTLDESLFQLSILLLGGSGNLKGPFWGTLLIMLLPEALRMVGLPSSVAANLRQIIYGGLLIMIMFIRPQGLGGEYKIK